MRGSAVMHALLLGLLLIFTFSMAIAPGDHLSAQTTATIFWISSLFCVVLLFNQLFSVEETNGSRLALLLLPYASQLIWLAKTCTGFFLLFISQLVFCPASIVFLGHTPEISALGLWLSGILLVDIGLCSLGTLLGALSQGQVSKESLLSVLLFPLLTPLLLAGISIYSQALERTQETLNDWFFLILAFDCIFVAVTIFLFPFIYSGDE